MCGFPIICQTPPKKSSKRKKSGIRLHISSGSHISITSLSGSLTINTGPPAAPKPKPKPAPSPTIPQYPAYTQTTAFTSPGPGFHPSYCGDVQYPQYASAFELPQLHPSHRPTYPHNLQEKSRRISSLLNDLSVFQTLSQKVAPTPAKIEAPEPSEMEKKLIEEFQRLRNDVKDKEGEEEVGRMLKRAREESFKGGHGQSLAPPSSAYNSRSYQTNASLPPDLLASQSLAGVGIGALPSQLGSRGWCRSRSRSRSRDSYRNENQLAYVMQGFGGRGKSLEAIYDGLGKIEATVTRIETRVADADFERDLDRVRFSRYAKRY